MTDPFEESLQAEETPDGPFRTGEPTREARLRRAREDSWARVARATEAAAAAQRRREAWWDWTCRALLGIAVVTLAGVVALWQKGSEEMGALVCPAVAFVIAAGLAVAYRARIGSRSR